MRTTFTEILKKLEPTNSRRVIERARLANSIAKSANEPVARLRAYATKTRALEHGIAKFPAEYGLSSVEDDGRLIAIRYARSCVLHVRLRDITSPTCEWVLQQRNEILAATSRTRAHVVGVEGHGRIGGRHGLENGTCAA